MELQERVAVVTGAAMGMGRELALRLAHEGCHLALCDISEDDLQAVKSECLKIAPTRTITAHRVDMGAREDVKRFAEDVKEAHAGKIHLLFNNAGIQRQGAWDRMSEADFDLVLRVNLDGVITATREFWPLLVAAAPDDAAVVNTSSVAGFFPPAGGRCVPYTVSKFAVRGFSEHLATDAAVMAPHIMVSCVHPGAIRTEITGRNMNMASVDMRFMKSVLPPAEYDRLMAAPEEERVKATRKIVDQIFSMGYTAKEAADMIVDGVIARKTRIMVGWDAVFLDWWVRAFPRIFTTHYGRMVSFTTSMAGRHLALPAALVAGAVVAWRWGRSRM